MPASIVNCENWEEADVVLLDAPYDRTSSFGKGADKGPAAIKEMLDRQIEFYSRWTRRVPADEVKIAYRDLAEQYADLAGWDVGFGESAPGEMVERVAEVYGRFFGKHWNRKFVVLLGGEHSVTNGALMAIRRECDTREVTVVQIDAHMDLRDTDADYNDKPWGKFAHSCVMRRTVEMGFNLVSVGVRAYSKDELDFALAHPNQIAFFEWGLEEAPPTSAAIVDVIQTEEVYLTVDAAGFRPASMPATGTPVQGGLEWWYGMLLIQEVFAQKRVIGADVVEVAPRPGDSLTEYGAAQIVYDMIGAKLAKGELGKK